MDRYIQDPVKTLTTSDCNLFLSKSSITDLRQDPANASIIDKQN